MKSKRFVLILLAGTLLLIIFALTFRGVADNPKLASDRSCSTANLSGVIDPGDVVAIFEGRKLTVPEVALSEDDFAVLSLASDERWIEIDLSEQKLRAWESDRLFLETPVSTGLPWWPTPTGEFRLWVKLRATKMEGGSGSTYYYLPNVPYVMYFGNAQVPNYRGYGLHGTYWHSDFGNPRSHGCVNLPTPIAKELYYWVGPVLPGGKSVVHSSSDNPGTRIVIHE